MKLITNKDYNCIKCGKYIYFSNEWEIGLEHHFCWSCGEPIEWITERSAEEVLEEIINLSKVYGSVLSKGEQGGEAKDKIQALDALDTITNQLIPLKQELLNLINK